MTMTKTIVNKICHRNSIQYFTCLLSLSIYGSLFVSLLQAFIFVWKVAKICQIFWSSQCFAEMTLIPKKVFFVIFYKYSWFPNSFLLLHFLQFVHICPSDVVSCVGKHLMGLQKNWTIYWWSQTDPKRRFDFPSATDRVNRGKTKRRKIQLVSYNTCWLLQQHSNTVSRYIFFSMECFGLVSIHCRRCTSAKANTARRLAILSLVLEQSWQGPAFQTTDDVGNTNLVSSRIFTNWQAF